MAHAELEDARKRAGGRHADHQALQNADLGMGLHHAHEAHDLVARHQAVGIERQHEGEILAPAGAEVAHVAGLEAGVVGAAAIDDAPAIGIGGLPGFHRLLLGGGDLRVIGIAQDEIAEYCPFTCRVHAGLDRPQAQDGALRVLVAHRHEHGGLDAKGCRLVSGRRIGRNLGQRVLAEMQEPQADERVPEAEHGPWRAGGEADEQNDIDPRPAAGAEHAGRHPQHRHIRDHVERENDPPPPRQHVDGLEARWCRKAERGRRQRPRRRGVETFAHADFLATFI